VRSPRIARTAALGIGLGLLLGLVAPGVGAQSVPPADTAPASPATEEDGDTRDVTWTLEVDAPSDLKALLERHLDLARYLRSPDTARVPRSELMRLRQAAPAQARALLETVGHFNARVTTSARDADVVTPSALPVIRLQLHVEPGPLTRVQQTRIEFEGALFLAAERGEPEAVALVEQLRRRWSLGPGEVYTQEAWSDAKGAVLARLRAEGYATAAWSGTVAQVDAGQDTARLFVVVDSGPLYRFGAVQIEGLDHVRADAVEALRPFEAGQPLREQALLDYQDRLVKSALFDAVSIHLEPDPARADALPVLVRVRERSLQQATFGIGVSDNTGPRVTLEHAHQRVAGFGWQARSKFQLARLDRQAAIDLTSHPHPGPYRNVFSAQAGLTEASGLEARTQRLRLGRSKDDERIERLYYVEWQRTRTRDTDDGRITDDTSAVSLNYQWVWRQLDHPLLPTRGTSLSLDTAVGRSYATVLRGGPFGRVSGRLTHYLTLGESWYGTARLQLGHVLARDDVAVPYTLLFRTGGDDTVRGYPYQGLGPSDTAGNAVGGRVLGVGSVELARPFLRRMPSLWGAVFVDAGNAAAHWNALDPALGYGVGMRWRSPVGALRVDLAYGQRLHRVRMHFSVGITF
jgi:translocation and assembly module TamA